MKPLKICFLITIISICLNTYGTIVQSVEQTETNEPKSWSFTVVENGDYEINEAWIHVTGGDTAILEIFKNDKRIYAAYALKAQVKRFENRLEGLVQGDEITVKAFPQNSSYELEYKIAFATPTFDGLPVYHVSDYGAFGNGTFNDQGAIENAINAAKNAGGGIVRFDPTKTYRVEGDEVYALDLANTENIKLIGSNPDNPGERAKLLLKSPAKVADITGSENIQVEGFIVDYAPLPYWQGEVLGANTTDWTIDVRVFDRYPVPVIDDWDWRFGRTFIPDSPGSRAGTGAHVWVNKVQQMPGETDGRHLRVFADATNSKVRAAVQDCANGKATELIMRTFEGTTGISYIFNIVESSRVLVKDFRFFRVPKQGITPSRNYGPVTLRNVEFRLPDASEDPVYNRETELLGSWRGHYLTRNNRFGILFDGATHDGGCLYDDMYNGHVHLALVNTVNGNYLISSINENGSNWEIGDWVSVWNHEQTIKHGMARIQNLSYANGNKQITVQLDRSVQGIVAGDASLVNEELLNRGTEIRNWTTTEIGAGQASFRIRTPLKIKDCHFENVFLWPSVEMEREGPRSRDVLIENTYMTSTATPLSIKDALDVTLKSCTIDNGTVILRGVDNRVLFDSVSWINMSGNILSLEGEDTAYVFNGCSRNGSKENLDDWAYVNNTSKIYYSAPDDYPPVVPPLVTVDLRGSFFNTEDKELKLYPNPADQYVYLQFPAGQKGEKIQLVDVNGKCILTNRIKYEEMRLSTASLRRGIYFLRYSSVDEVISKKFVVQ